MSEKANAHSIEVTSVQFSPDGSKIVSGSYDKTVKVWDAGVLESPKALFLDPYQGPMSATFFAASLNEVGSITAGSSTYSVDFSPDGTKIVSGLGSGTIKVWDLGAY